MTQHDTHAMPTRPTPLLPHIASGTIKKTRQAMAARVSDHLQSFFAHGSPLLPAP